MSFFVVVVKIFLVTQNTKKKPYSYIIGNLTKVYYGTNNGIIGGTYLHTTIYIYFLYIEAV